MIFKATSLNEVFKGVSIGQKENQFYEQVLWQALWRWREEEKLVGDSGKKEIVKSEENQGSGCLEGEWGKCFQIKHARNWELGNANGNVEIIHDLDKAVFMVLLVGFREDGHRETGERKFEHL